MIYIGSDHAGFSLKTIITAHVSTIDMGCHNDTSVDYVDYAVAVCRAIKNDDFGILICGSGIGMSIVANRFSHINAALCCGAEQARLARMHNNANILCLGARFLTIEQAVSIVNIFLDTPFAGEERHIRRLEKIRNLAPCASTFN